jgi:hypothetical protein
MKKVIFLFACLFALMVSVSNYESDNFVKEKTEQSASIVMATTSSLL